MRCKWVNMKNPKYVKYHDEEWGKPCHDEHMLYEMFILETFQAGLSWECILNKREYFKEAYDNFDINKVIKYDENKINELLNNKKIIRNRYKIKYSILNSKIYKDIVSEYGSFNKYIWGFSNNKVVVYDTYRTTSELSDRISKDLIKRGMKFVGSVTIFSYLQAIGIINSHDFDCDYR